ncbi:MAG: hypothetical protein PHD81_01720 [Candidatus Nanoarchaeia archaeon]|nr:hypothetical protein [Candidatus Nanoarchaeia archaeon]MDD5587807.1 hypothetical protein [Candidatus Nanoarchaeia archaeon]
MKKNLGLQITILIFFCGAFIALLTQQFNFGYPFLDNVIISLKPFFLIALIYLIMPLIILLYDQTFPNKSRSIKIKRNRIYSKILKSSFHIVALIMFSVIIGITYGILFIELNKIISLKYPLELFAITYILSWIILWILFKKRFKKSVIDPLYF